MKKLLLIGKLNKTVKEMNDVLSRRFQVQVCAESLELVQGMMEIIKPDLILISVMELEDVETKVFDFLSESYTKIPVLVVGTKESCTKYQQYYEENQFTKLVRPISKDILMNKCYRLLNMKEISEGEQSGGYGGSRGRKHILVVDDSSVTLRSIKAMLDQRYEVSVATSGKQALKSMQKSRPDLILLDYEMPGCDGRETLELIRADEELADIPVIFLTGVADKEHIAAVLRLNPAGYFLKPPIREKLMQAIADNLEKCEE